MVFGHWHVPLVTCAGATSGSSKYQVSESWSVICCDPCWFCERNGSTGQCRESKYLWMRSCHVIPAAKTQRREEDHQDWNMLLHLPNTRWYYWIGLICIGFCSWEEIPRYSQIGDISYLVFCWYKIELGALVRGSAKTDSATHFGYARISRKSGTEDSDVLYDVVWNRSL